MDNLTKQQFARDITSLVLRVVNNCLCFHPDRIVEITNPNEYESFKYKYMMYRTGVVKKSRPKMYLMPCNVSSLFRFLQSLSVFPIDEYGNRTTWEQTETDNDYKVKILSELDCYNIRRVEMYTAYVVYSVLNKRLDIETVNSPDYEEPDPDEDIDEELLAAMVRPGDKSLVHNYEASIARTKESLAEGKIFNLDEVHYCMGVTQWHFHRLFDQVMGMSIKKYSTFVEKFVDYNYEFIENCKVFLRSGILHGRYSMYHDRLFYTNRGFYFNDYMKSIHIIPGYLIDSGDRRRKKKKEVKTLLKAVREEIFSKYLEKISTKYLRNAPSVQYLNQLCIPHAGPLLCDTEKIPHMDERVSKVPDELLMNLSYPIERTIPKQNSFPSYVPRMSKDLLKGNEGQYFLNLENANTLPTTSFGPAINQIYDNYQLVGENSSSITNEEEMNRFFRAELTDMSSVNLHSSSSENFSRNPYSLEGDISSDTSPETSMDVVESNINDISGAILGGTSDASISNIISRLNIEGDRDAFYDAKNISMNHHLALPQHYKHLVPPKTIRKRASKGKKRLISRD